MKGAFNRRKSLQELEKEDWGEPTYNSSLVITVHRLRRKPLAEFTVGDLRIMIGQKVSLPFLIPLAVERLEAEPLAEGKYYPGDLLQVVSQAGETFWANHADSFQRIRKVVCRVKDLLPSLDESDRSSILRVLSECPGSLTI